MGRSTNKKYDSTGLFPCPKNATKKGKNSQERAHAIIRQPPLINPEDATESEVWYYR